MPSTATNRLQGLTTSVAVKPPCITVATSNITLSGLQTVSGVVVVEGDRVLVTGQSTSSENGIYIASTGSWVRAKDFDGELDVVQGTIVLVRSEVVDGAIYEVTTANPITIGTTSIIFELRDDPAITYVQTQAEIAASVTPVNLALRPGNVLRYGTNTVPGTTDMTAAINNALASNNSVYAPAGTYRVASSIIVWPFNELYGDGWGDNPLEGGTIFLATEDIEIIVSDNTTLSGALPYVHLHDFTAQCTVTDNTTKYQIHLEELQQSCIERVKTRSGLADTNYSETNIAGIWIENPGGEGTYINHFVNNFVQNGGLLISSGTDSTIVDNFIYGHCCPHSLKITGGAGNFEIRGNNISSPPSGAGIDLDGGFVTNVRISGNFFDGNPSNLDSGYGILVSGSPRVNVANNIIWAMGKAGIRAVDPVGLVVVGNTFLNCNDEDDGHSDVEIVGSSFQPSQVIVSANFFQQESDRTNKGYAITEGNAGFNPVGCVYQGNVISTNYLTTGSFGSINTLQSGAQIAHVMGNSGGGSETESRDEFTATLTGCTTSPTGTAKYTREGNDITLYIPSISGTSNTTAATLTGVPTAIRPGTPQLGSALITNNGVTEIGAFTVDTDGSITLYRPGDAAFTASGTKGTVSGNITYQKAFA